MKILIVGAGLGGVMLAACLQRRGIDYQLIEKSPNGQQQGFSLGIWHNTRQLFQYLQLEDSLDALGSRMHSYEVREDSGRLLRHVNFAELYARYGMAYTQVNRRKLRQLVVSKIDSTKIAYGQKITAINQHSDRVEVVLSDGSTATGDVLVGADGVHSFVRDCSFCSGLQKFFGWRAWYVGIDHRYQSPNGMVEYVGAGRCLSIFDDEDYTLTIFFAQRALGQDNGPDKAAQLKKLFHRELRHLPGCLDGIPDDRIMATDLARVDSNDWVRGRVVLIGDAAHAVEPHTGMGGAMAMEDAYVLAEQLATSADVATALNNYQRLRIPRIKVIRRLTKGIGMFAFMRSAVLRRAANLVIPYLPQSVYYSGYYRMLDESVVAAGRVAGATSKTADASGPDPSTSFARTVDESDTTNAFA
jgi:2-polyprenyl-6-methoxyphenol hydroxylase-like FAD-dependent oxidoreductase